MNDTTPPHVQRMLIERYELFKKVLDLKKFIDENPLFKTLPEGEQTDMREQLGFMALYQKALESRIRRADPQGVIA